MGKHLNKTSRMKYETAGWSGVEVRNEAYADRQDEQGPKRSLEVKFRNKFGCEWCRALGTIQ
ncbi:hypothetical protein ACTXT7_010220 [Hymenolepis weldensis]